jgi:hypothetical protein
VLTPALFHLQAGGTSVVVDASLGGMPAILHWGPDLGPCPRPASPRQEARRRELAADGPGGLWAWNDFLLPLVILSDPEARTLPLAQYVFQSQFNTNYTVAFASYLMALAPLLLVYLVAQR